MSTEPDAFRDFGILPRTSPPPPERVRASYPWEHVIGQCLVNGVMVAAAVVLAWLNATIGSFSKKLVTIPLPLVFFGVIIYFRNRHDFVWIELDGKIIRAKHLFTRRVMERRIEDRRQGRRHSRRGRFAQRG